MNEKFFSLPEERRVRMMNAGYRVFAHNSYKKSPMGEIAEAAGISKPLLFHYFGNKRGLYLFLWQACVESTQRTMERHGCYEPMNFFEQMRRGLRAKMELTRKYPDMALFAMKSFYEDDAAVYGDVRRCYEHYLNKRGFGTVSSLHPEDFRPGVNLRMMYREMFLTAEGYVWEMLLRGSVDADQLEREFGEMIDFWEDTYGARREEAAHERD